MTRAAAPARSRLFVARIGHEAVSLVAAEPLPPFRLRPDRRVLGHGAGEGLRHVLRLQAAGGAVAQPAATRASAAMEEVRSRLFMGDHSLDSATTGSSRAAFIAGAKPKTRPVATAQVNAMIMGRRVKAMGVPNADINIAVPMPPRTPRTPPRAETAGRFGQELLKNIARPGAGRHADADFAGPFSNADQHDVHDAYAAHEERNSSHRGQQDRQRVLGGGRGLEDVGHVADEEILDAVVPLLEQGGHFLLDLVHGRQIADRDGDRADVALAEDPQHAGRERDEDDIVRSSPIGLAPLTDMTPITWNGTLLIRT